MNTLFDIYLCLTKMLLLPELCSIIVQNIDDYHCNIFDSMLKEVNEITSLFRMNHKITATYCADHVLYMDTRPKLVDTKQKIKSQKLKDGTNVTIYTGWVIFNGHDLDCSIWNDCEILRRLKEKVQKRIIHSKYLSIPQQTGYYDLFMGVEKRIDQYGDIRRSKNKERKIANKLHDKIVKVS